jgi:hypothetical protein
MNYSSEYALCVTYSYIFKDWQVSSPNMFNSVLYNKNFLLLKYFNTDHIILAYEKSYIMPLEVIHFIHIPVSPYGA